VGGGINGGGEVSIEQEEAMDKRRRIAVMALDVALLCFARWRVADPTPQWILNGSKVFRTDGTVYDFSPKFIGMLGYHASLKTTLSGLSLVKDISVTCFMRGGNMVDFLCTVCGFQKDRLASQMERGQRLEDHREWNNLLELLKNCKIRTRHLNQNKKFREFGPPANSMESAFTDERGNRTTVAQYFHGMVAKCPDAYQPLAFPFLPTVNVGSKQRSVLVPMELVDIVPGQTRTRSVTGDISAQIIKYAAMLPNDRFKNISQNSSLFEALADDQDAEHFGLAQIAATMTGGAGPQPMRVTGTILPPPILQYGNKTITPEFKGAWNMSDRTTFAFPAPVHASGSRGTRTSSPTRLGESSYMYGAMFVHDGRETDSTYRVNDLLQKLENASRQLGIPLRLIGDGRQQQSAASVLSTDTRKMREILQGFKSDGARIVVVVLVRENFYFDVKRFADEICLPTQCARFGTVKKFPRNYENSLLMKMNMKMGGVNHTLAARGSAPSTGPADRPIFQNPPQSISWVFDLPTMVVVSQPPSISHLLSPV